MVISLLIQTMSNQLTHIIVSRLLLINHWVNSSAALPKLLPNYFANSIGNELYLYGKKCSSLHGQL